MRRFNRNLMACMACVMAMVGFTNAAQAIAPLNVPPGTYEYKTVIHESGKEHARLFVTFRTKGDLTHVKEERKAISGNGSDVYELTLNHKTGQLLKWTQTVTKDGQKTITQMEETKTHLIATTTYSNKKKKKVERIERPKGPYTVVPLVKFFIASEIGKGRTKGSFSLAVFAEGSLQEIGLDFKKEGEKTVSMMGKKQTCTYATSGPTSFAVSLVIPRGDLCVSKEKRPVLLQAVSKPTRFSDVMGTTLVRRQ